MTGSKCVLAGGVLTGSDGDSRDAVLGDSGDGGGVESVE